MRRTDIINHLIDFYGYKTYLEIGTQSNKNFDAIRAQKEGVDPDIKAGATHCMTSDRFFMKEAKGRKWDIFFVDGLHHSDQVLRDIHYCLKHMNEGGAIVCHDMNPQKEIEQRVPRETKRWNGDCWKALVKLRQERDDLDVYTVDADEGCAVIRYGNGEPMLGNVELTYENLDNNRERLLNLISVDEFLTKVKKKKS